MSRSLWRVHRCLPDLGLGEMSPLAVATDHQDTAIGQAGGGVAGASLGERA